MKFENLGLGAVIGIGCLTLILMVLVHLVAIPLAIIFVVNAIWGIKLSYWVVVLAWWVVSILFNKLWGK